MILWTINTPITIIIAGGEPGLSITYELYGPLGLVASGSATDRGDGTYSVSFTPNEEGVWLVRWVFPDGYVLISQVLVRLSVLNTDVHVRVQAETSGLSITCKIITPGGHTVEKQATDLGGGLYEAVFTVTESGLYTILWVFPDGMVLVDYLVVPTPEQVTNKQIYDLLEKVYYLLRRHDGLVTALLLG